MKHLYGDRLRATVCGGAAVLALGLVSAGCATEEPVGTGEPAISTLRLTVASQLITINALGDVTGGPIVLRAGIPANVSAVWLTPTGETEPRITPALYQLNAAGVGVTPITFTRSTTDPFAGTLVSNVPNITGTLRLSLHNVEEQHDLWGPREVTFVVSN